MAPRRARPRKSEGLKKVGDLLPDLAERGGWGGVVELCRLQAEWPGLVGATLAAHAAPERIVRGRLTVVVDTSAWLVQLSFFKAEIQRKVNGLLGEGRVNDVFLQVGRLRPAAPPAPERPRAPADPEAVKAVDACVAEVPDGAVREALRRLLLRDLGQAPEPPDASGAVSGDEGA
jgi:hypothetical protein